MNVMSLDDTTSPSFTVVGNRMAAAQTREAKSTLTVLSGPKMTY
jgi:hypothetical protein